MLHIHIVIAVHFLVLFASVIIIISASSKMEKNKRKQADNAVPLDYPVP